MGKTRNFFKKIRDTKGTCHAKIGLIKDRSGMDLAEAEDIKKTWQEYTEELYKKDLHDQDDHDGVITHLEPDILECEVKWALESITMNKASGGDGIPVELFQILKDDAVKVLHSICQQIWKTQLSQSTPKSTKGQRSYDIFLPPPTIYWLWAAPMDVNSLTLRFGVCLFQRGSSGTEMQILTERSFRNQWR